VTAPKISSERSTEIRRRVGRGADAGDSSAITRVGGRAIGPLGDARKWAGKNKGPLLFVTAAVILTVAVFYYAR
jgi:hypothetical protein